MQSIKTPEQETEYPDPGRFGTTATHGFLVRHVKNIEMSNIEIVCDQKDMRPAFALEDVQGAEFFGINAPHEPNVPIFDLTNVSDLSIARVKSVPDTQIDHVDGKKI